MRPKKKKNDNGNEKKKGKAGRKTTKSDYLKKIEKLNMILVEAEKEAITAENEFFAVEKNYIQIQDDLGDIIEFLQHEIQVKEDEVLEWNVKITECKKELKKQDDYYKDIFTKMENEYQVTKHALDEQTNIVKAKMNALEEVRQLREDFVKKQEELGNVVEEKRLQQQQEIYQAEKTTIIDQDKIQKDMEAKIKQLTEDFREATEIRMEATTNRIIKDNIQLANKLTCMQEKMKKIRKNYEMFLNSERKNMYGLQLRDDEYESALKRYEERVRKINDLASLHENLTRKIASFRLSLKDNEKLSRKSKELERELKLVEEESHDFKKSIEKTEESTLAKNKLNWLKKKSQIGKCVL